jgi:hypothetical protein
MDSLRLSVALFTCTTLLAACGGGGGSTSTPTPTPATPIPASVSKVEGFYTGTVSSGTQFQLLALENDQVYALIGNTDSQGTFRVVSLVEGAGTSANGGFSVANAKEYAASGQVFTGNISGSFAPKASISGTVVSSSGTASFTGTEPSISSYSYDVATPISTIAGDWSGATLSNEAVNFSIAATGAISGRSASGCTFTGSAAPRATGKNVLDASVTFGGAPCGQPGITATGIAISNLVPSGKRQLIFAVNNAGRTLGTVVFAQR